MQSCFTFEEIVSLAEDLPLDRKTIFQQFERIKTNSLDRALVVLGSNPEYEYSILSGRILLAHVRKHTCSSLIEFVRKYRSLLNEDIANFISDHADELQREVALCEEKSDNDNDFMSASTLVRSYLLKDKGTKDYPIDGIIRVLNSDYVVVERTQFLYIRVAVQHYFAEGIESVIQMYRDLTSHAYTPASPTLFNAGTKHPQLSSCFLLTVDDDLEDILQRGQIIGTISAHKAGLGLDVSRIRHSEMSGGGMSTGLVPWLMYYDKLIDNVNQKGKRNGALTAFVRPHHIDIFSILKLIDPSNAPNNLVRLNLALWVSDLFMQRVKEDGNWTLFCPAHAPLLNDLYGTEFATQYQIYEKDETIPSYARKVIKAIDLMTEICKMQSRYSTPYMLYEDACNFKSNQKYLGYIRCSNLCLEIMEHTSRESIASCNLSSINLRTLVRKDDRTFDFEQLARVTRTLVRNLSYAMRYNWYPLDEGAESIGRKRSGKKGIINETNGKYRPIGIGVSGFAEVIYQLDLTFLSPETKLLNKKIFACIYFNALDESRLLAKKYGSYEGFAQSPLGKGKLQFDLWVEEYQKKIENGFKFLYRKPEDDLALDPSTWGDTRTWDDLRSSIRKDGCYNSLLVALMPTATTAQLLCNTETIEAPMSNIFSRDVMSGNFLIVNHYMIEDLKKVGLWNKEVLDWIRSRRGSIKGITTLFGSKDNQDRLRYLEEKYLTMWEIDRKTFLDMAADRARYIDQSQSTNVYMLSPNKAQIFRYHVYANDIGLKTGMYYLRSSGGSDKVMQLTVNADVSAKKEEKFVCTREPGCMACE